SRAKSAAIGGQDLIGKPYLAFEITVKALTLVMRARLEKSAAIQKDDESPSPPIPSSPHSNEVLGSGSISGKGVSGPTLTPPPQQHPSTPTLQHSSTPALPLPPSQPKSFSSVGEPLGHASAP